MRWRDAVGRLWQQNCRSTPVNSPKSAATSNRDHPLGTNLPLSRNWAIIRQHPPARRPVSRPQRRPARFVVRFVVWFVLPETDAVEPGRQRRKWELAAARPGSWSMHWLPLWTSTEAGPDWGVSSAEMVNALRQFDVGNRINGTVGTFGTAGKGQCRRVHYSTARCLAAQGAALPSTDRPADSRGRQGAVSQCRTSRPQPAYPAGSTLNVGGRCEWGGREAPQSGNICARNYTAKTHVPVTVAGAGRCCGGAARFHQSFCQRPPRHHVARLFPAGVIRCLAARPLI